MYAAMPMRWRWPKPATIPKIHKFLRPSGGDALEIFEAVERVRVEAIGARRMQGVARNLQAKWRDRYKDGEFDRFDND